MAFAMPTMFSRTKNEYGFSPKRMILNARWMPNRIAEADMSPTERVENIPEKNTLSRSTLNSSTPWLLSSMMTGSTNTAATSMTSKLTKLASPSQ